MFLKNQDKKSRNRINEIKNKIPPQYLSNLPHLELLGNRQVTVEGSKGILKYADDTIRLNAGSMVITFSGRNLNVRCIGTDCTMVDGFISNIEFTV